MADYFLVERARGAAWDHSRSRREQDGWDEHAAFMDGLVEEGFVVLGGPMGVGCGCGRADRSAGLHAFSRAAAA